MQIALLSQAVTRYCIIYLVNLKKGYFLRVIFFLKMTKIYTYVLLCTAIIASPYDNIQLLTVEALNIIQLLTNEALDMM